jgi:nitrate/TMAO reductase-like tetraheme cytochrome c subunit
MTEPTEPTVPTEASKASEASEASLTPDSAQADQKVPAVRHFRRTRAFFAPVSRVLGKIPHPPWHSKRGVLVLLLLIGGFGTVVGVGGMTAVHYSETPGFCGLCHTMDPELKAYAMSAHKDVTCAECHINPGLGGFVKAKANGTKQLLHILTGQYPKPIEPPDHADLPPVKDSCLKCHSLEQITENGGPVKLVLRARYKPDETNTRETVAILLRPAGLGQASATPGAAADDGVKGVHWHVEQKVTYTASDIHAQKIDLVEFTAKDGTKKQYIAGTQVAVSTDVNPDIQRLKSSQKTKTMDCIDCHNRVGHAVPSPDRAIDDAIAAGRISTALPFIKRDSVALLNGDYSSLQAADTAITGLRTTFATRYPLVFKTQAAQVTKAIDELKVQYRLIATPAMKVQAKTYPDNLGHQSSPGCFRCHDGAHYLVVKGKITNDKIPSECATCHTFPQIGASASSFPLGSRPASHQDKLWAFSHKIAVSSRLPAGTTCAACHARTYCENCHKSGAIKVEHNAMLYNHASAIRAAGGTTACAYCHLPVYCKQCHKGPVLDPATPPTGTQPLAIKARPAT